MRHGPELRVQQVQSPPCDPFLYVRRPLLHRQDLGKSRHRAHGCLLKPCLGTDPGYFENLYRDGSDIGDDRATYQGKADFRADKAQ